MYKLLASPYENVEPIRIVWDNIHSCSKHPEHEGSFLGMLPVLLIPHGHNTT